MSVSESWLSKQDPDGLLLDSSGYNIYRDDRASIGGGTCIFVRSNLKCKLVFKSNGLENINLVCIDILGASIEYRIMVCYVPPASCNITVENVTRFFEGISNLFVCDCPIILQGDFNFPDIVWSRPDLVPVQYRSKISSIFIDFVVQNALLQFVHSPTRADNILDLVLANDAYSINPSRSKEFFNLVRPRGGKITPPPPQLISAPMIDRKKISTATPMFLGSRNSTKLFPIL